MVDQNRPKGAGGTIWGVLLSLGALTQLVGFFGNKPHLMLSNHIDARIHQGVVVVVFALGAWLFWHWGVGRKLPASWVDGVFVLLGVAYWWVSLKWPIQP